MDFLGGDWDSTTTTDSNPFDSPNPPSYATDPSASFGFSEPVNFTEGDSNQQEVFFGEPASPLVPGAQSEFFEPSSNEQTNFNDFLDEPSEPIPPSSPVTQNSNSGSFGSNEQFSQSPVSSSKSEKKSAVSSAFGSVGKGDLLERSSFLQLEYYFKFFL